MARVDVVMPQMGESITEGTVVRWHKKVGDKVRKDEVLLEISTDKVDSEIPSPATGVLSLILVAEQKTVPVQTVIAYLETEGGLAEPPTSPAVTTAEAKSPEPVRPTVPVAGPPRPADLERPAPGRFYSPLVLTIARTEGLSMAELERVPGTGEGGRVTRKDVLAYLRVRHAGSSVPGAAQESGQMRPPALSVRPADAPDLQKKYPAPDFEILQMSTVLQKMAQHMVHSVQTSPHVAAIHEVDMSAIARHREKKMEEFERREGFKLTYMPYVAYALVQVLKRHPMLNSSVEGDKIIRKNFVNLGIAVASEAGLLVPVIKHAEEKSLLGIARSINDLAVRTRTKKLTPTDVQGGTFSISNYGVFGSLIGTPIINQPQSAILGTGAVKKRAVVVDDAIAIRSMAYLTLSFDHRIIDGAAAGMFMDELVRALEGFDPATKL